LTPRALIAELLGEHTMAPDVLATAWPITLLDIAHMTEDELGHLLNLPADAARRLAAALELHRRLVRAGVPLRPTIRTPEDALAVLAPMCSQPVEGVWLLALDARRRLIGPPRMIVTDGEVDGVDAGPRAVFRAAVVMGAASAIVAINRPRGDLTVTAIDMGMVRRIAAAGRMLDVLLVDVLVVTPDRHRWCSLRRETPACFG
jgi:DNA repair protein RadC